MNSSPLFFDASNVISWGPQPLVGIPRVETALVRQALVSGHRIVRRDATGGGLRLLSDAELAHLASLLGHDATADNPPAAALSARVARARRLSNLAQGRAGPEFERYLAGIVAGHGRRQGLAYQAAKVFVRTSLIGPTVAPEPRGAMEGLLDDPRHRIFLSSRTTHNLSPTALECRAQLFAFLHDLIPLRGEPFFPARNAIRFRDEAGWIARHCTRVFCPSDFTCEEAVREFPGQAAKFVTAYPAGLLRDATQAMMPVPPRRPAGFPEDFVVYCATIEPRKNHALLAQVWARLHRKLGAACPALYLVGRRGWKCAEAEDRIRSARAAGVPVAILTGISDAELVWLYRHARFGVYPSVVEGFGLGVAECLDFGLPVLISDAAALAEAAQHLMPTVPAADADAWLVALEGLVTEPSRLAELRARVANRYLPRGVDAFFASVVASMQA